MKSLTIYSLLILLFGCKPAGINIRPDLNINSTIVNKNSIEFKNSTTGPTVCRYPENTCRTDANELSGGSTAYGTIGNPDSFIHYMKFRFYSNGYFAKNPDGHIAFGLRGQRLRVEDYGADKAGVDGRGIIFGHIGYGYALNKNNIACVDRMAQIESYFRSAVNNHTNPNGNIIIPATCSDTILEDYKWYTVEIEVTSHQYIIYKIFNEANQLIYKTFYNDQPNYIDPKLTSWFIGHVFDTPNSTWSFRLENFEVGHIPTGDQFYPVKDFVSPITFSTRFGVASGNSAHDFSLILNKSIPSEIKINNIYNRSRVYGCANYRTSKLGLDNKDCSLATNYRTMTFATETDWSLVGNSLVLKESFMKSYPNQFYTIYFRLNPQDELTQSSLSFEMRD